MRRFVLIMGVVAACADDGGLQPDARAPRPDATVLADAGRDAAPDADAARDASRVDSGGDAGPADAGLTCEDLRCPEGTLCKFGSCDDADCTREPTCMRVVETCEECSAAFEICWQPLCVKSPSPCPTTCEYVRPACKPSCGAEYVCSYDGADCTDAGTCTARTICGRGAKSCDDCRGDETCREAFLVDLTPVITCVAN